MFFAAGLNESEHTLTITNQPGSTGTFFGELTPATHFRRLELTAHLNRRPRLYRLHHPLLLRRRFFLLSFLLIRLICIIKPHLLRLAIFKRFLHPSFRGIKSNSRLDARAAAAVGDGRDACFGVDG